MVVIVVLLIILLTILAAQNTLPCTIAFLGLTFHLPIIVPLLAFLLLGFLLGFIYSEVDARRARHQQSKRITEALARANHAEMELKLHEQEEQRQAERATPATTGGDQ